jgi:hypothetical protein
MKLGQLPGFTAEHSLNSSTGETFRTTLRYASIGSSVHPQRARGPWGPIGLPGQDCDGACLHICMTFGGGADCFARCRDNCADASLMFTR